MPWPALIYVCSAALTYPVHTHIDTFRHMQTQTDTDKQTQMLQKKQDRGKTHKYYLSCSGKVIVLLLILFSRFFVQACVDYLSLHIAKSCVQTIYQEWHLSEDLHGYII